MDFCEQLNKYMEELRCSSKDLVDASGLSSAVISRYRKGERTPFLRSEQIEKLSDGLYKISKDKKIFLTRNEIYNTLSHTLSDISIDFKQLSKNFQDILFTLNINTSDLSRAINYDASLLSKIRTGNRNPSKPREFIKAVCEFIVAKYKSEDDKKSISLLIGCPVNYLKYDNDYFARLSNWFSTHASSSTNKIDKFLNNLDDFNLDKYIKAINFDKIKIPFVPFYKCHPKTYYGIEEMKRGELDFFKATILSKSREPVFMCSDMPMDDMAEDIEFSKKWMIAIALTLKKGLRLNVIHNLDRPFNEMMLGLESWIPIYMTGQISPYYLTGLQNSVYCHLNYVSGAAALAGECIKGHHNKGKYSLVRKKSEIAYYKLKSECLINKAKPLMEIYRSENKNSFDVFSLCDSSEHASRKRILSSLPIHTISEKLLLKILNRNNINNSELKTIFDEIKKQKSIIENILEHDILEDKIPYLSKKEFENHSLSLCLSNAFYSRNINYTYEEYLEHLSDTQKYSTFNSNYKISLNHENTFKNIDITIHCGKWVMISKNNSPAIHFVIHHPKLRNAIENFIAPVRD